MMNERAKDLIYSAIFIVCMVTLIFFRSCQAEDVYMQLLSPEEVSSSVRALTKDARMTEEQCLEQKEKVEAPLNTGHYSISSGWRVECIPVDYLDD